MGTFQVTPAKQLPTQFRQLQRNVRQLQHGQVNSSSKNISWTLAAYGTGWGPSVVGQDLLYEFTPDGNFVYMSGILLIPSTTPPSLVATLAPECAPVRPQAITVMQDNGGSSVAHVLLIVDTSANVTAYGTLTAGWNLDISGFYPVNAVAS